MSMVSLSGESSGIFSDAVNISHYGSSSFTNPSVVSEERSSLGGMLIGDAFLSPNEAQMFKKIQKIISENKSLKRALLINSERLQSHVNDCIKWKDTHRVKENGLKDQLQKEQQKTNNLERRLAAVNTAMNSASTTLLSTGTIETLLSEIENQSQKLKEIMGSSKEPFESDEDGIKQAYEECLNAMSEFISGRNPIKFHETLTSVQEVCLSFNSIEGKLLQDTVLSLQNASQDYAQPNQAGRRQVLLAQHIELKDQFDTILEENQELKNKIKTSHNKVHLLEKSIQKITQERDDLCTGVLEKGLLIKRLTDELENCRSVEILDLTPQQQPKEIKQLEANIESYKKTIDKLKDQNETLFEDLNETTSAFDKIEEENSNLRDQVDELQEKFEQLSSENPASDKLQKDLDEAISKDLESKQKIKELTKNVENKESDVKELNEQLKQQQVNFETRNRVQKNRESKDADRINDLLKKNEELKNENQNAKSENEAMREHIESFSSIIQKQNLSQKQDFATLLGKSEELMSLDTLSMTYENIVNDEYTQKVLHENERLLETAESQRINLEELKAREEKASKAYVEIVERLAYVERETKRYNDSLQNEIQKSQELAATNILYEEQLRMARGELSRYEVNKKERLSQQEAVDELNEKFAAQQKIMKKENQQMWNNLQAKVKTIKDMEEKINQLTTEILGAKELISELREKELVSNENVMKYREQDRKQNLEISNLKESFQDVALLRMQLDVYKNDFQAERDSREKQQANLLEVQERLQQVQVENHQLKEELHKRGNAGLHSIRQRHNGSGGGIQQQQQQQQQQQLGWSHSPQQNDPRHHYNMQQQMRTQHPDQVGQWGGAGGGQPGDQWQVYGRGNEHIYASVRNSPSAATRVDDDEQRKCPKCQMSLPDLDSLQIHVMECLDK